MRGDYDLAGKSEFHVRMSWLRILRISGGRCKRLQSTLELFLGLVGYCTTSCVRRYLATGLLSDRNVTGNTGSSSQHPY